MKRLLAFCLPACFSFAPALGQSFTGYDVSSYSGVYATLFNPANLLDHRFKADVNICGLSGGFQNSTFILNLKNRGDALEMPAVIEQKGRGGVFVDGMGPGFALRLNDKNGIAVTSRFRFGVNADNLDPGFLNIFHKDASPFNGSRVTLPGGSVQTHAWNELAFTYCRQIGVSDFGVWKAAVSLKVLGGQGAAYLKTNQFSFTYADSARIDFDARVKYGGAMQATGNLNLMYSDFLDDYSNHFSYRFLRQPGIAADIGLTYEYRDEMQVYETAYNEETLNYKWKIGVSVSDIGSIRYHSSTLSYRAQLSGQSYVFEDLAPPSDSTTITSIGNWYRQQFPGASVNTRFSMALPTTVHFSFDYAFNPYLSVAAHFLTPVLMSKAPNYTGTHSLTQVSVTPRAELSWAGVYLPLTYQYAGGWQAGMAVRIGPLTVGSGSLIRVGLLRKAKTADAYFLLRVPLFHFRPYKVEEPRERSKPNRHVLKAVFCPKR